VYIQRLCSLRLPHIMCFYRFFSEKKPKNHPKETEEEIFIIIINCYLNAIETESKHDLLSHSKRLYLVIKFMVIICELCTKFISLDPKKTTTLQRKKQTQTREFEQIL
jgi:hypothetical protein